MTDEQISELIAKFDLQEAINNAAGHRDVDPRELDEFLYSQIKKDKTA